MDYPVIVEASRTPIGVMGGALKTLHSLDLATEAVSGAVERSRVDPESIEEVIFGHCRQTSDDANIARIAALRAGIPEKASAHTVMRHCASGMTAVHNGAMQIMCGLSEVVLCGGVESMSTCVYYIRDARYGLGNGNQVLVDTLTEGQFAAQPQEIYGRFNMGMTAENIAEMMKISREDQDDFAFRSQTRAVAAIDSGKFEEEILPVTIPAEKKIPAHTVEMDEGPRRGLLREKLATLKPVFRTDGLGTVTAGNSSGRNDGASAILLMSETAAARQGLKPLARVLGMGTAGCDPRTMGLGPVYAVPKALSNAGLRMDDMELIELNEAFAAQSLGCIRMLHWEDRMEQINVNGGAIALGHPSGCSGNRILVTLIHEMRRQQRKYGLATLCVAGGMGQATVIEALY